MKLSMLFFGMVFAATMFVALGAKAQPVNLTCTYGDYELRVTFDESAGTAVAGDDPISNAKFTDTTITWMIMNDHYEAFYTLNRNTGKLNIHTSTKDNNNRRTPQGNIIWHQGGGTYQCIVGEVQRKF
ncbi:MAG: hypothetical protein ABSC77_10110 [Terracidiphilus sp.]|jgi:hypothetical protein